MSENRFDFDPINEDGLFVPPATDCEWPTAWEYAVTTSPDRGLEDELKCLADDVPAPRSGLRDDFLLELGRVERRRERLRQLPVIAAFVAAGLLGIFGPRPGLSDAGTAVAKNTPPRHAMPFVAHQFGPDELVTACREGDSWALVDAYSNMRDRNRDRLGLQVADLQDDTARE